MGRLLHASLLYFEEEAMRLIDPVEILYLVLMSLWEKSAPPNGKQGLLDGEPERNTQISRMVYLLRKAKPAAGWGLSY